MDRFFYKLEIFIVFPERKIIYDMLIHSFFFQYGKELFNKGKLMNAAFCFAEKLKVDCVIFHDVDMFPADDRINYGCPDTPRHIGAYVNTLGYRLAF